MDIRNLFARDIERNINPAVVVTEQDQTTISTEIEEYVFTPDLIDNLYTFLNELFNRKDGKTAIWINGYYGSGKSHFIKYVHYCINKNTCEAAFDHFIENAKDQTKAFSDATPSNILQLKKKVLDSSVNNIMFNIDAVSPQRDNKAKLPIIILNQFNAFRGYNSKNIALAILVEKHLDRLGKYEAFKSKINKLGSYDWDKDAATLVSLKLDKVLDVVLELDPDIDRDSLRAKLKNPDDITIEGNLIPEFLEYLEDKPDSYRLVFLIDEVSQYIGSNTNLLLNLQTIIEEVGSKCGNKVWFATTAQQSLENVIENTEISGEDFGKILGRFETRISLQSQDAAYITKKRVLDKTSSGLTELKSYYDSNKDPIHNQFTFNSDLYPGYDGFDEFSLSYPFIPYQFRLISDVFESFSQLDYVIKEVKDNERSVLGITHFTVKEHGDEKVGYFIPFDAFFNSQFRKNLTHSARRIIDRAVSLDFVNSDAFAQRVVSTLFMISNLSDTKKIAFPANLDNLTTLLIDETDANRLELQQKIQQVLDQLIDQSIIREEGGQYHFLKEDEIEVANLVNNLAITMEDRLRELNDSIFGSLLNIKKRTSYGDNNFDLAISFDDKQIFPSGDIEVLFSFFDKKDLDQLAMNTPRDNIVFCVNDRFLADNTLRQDFDQFVRTKNYLKQNMDTATGIRKKTLEDFATRNQGKLSEIRAMFANCFRQAPVISAQQIIKSGISTSDPKARYDEALQLHFSSVYKKQQLAKSYATTNEALKQAALSKQTALDKSLTTAEDEVDTWIDRMGTTTVAEVVREFGKAPYGWRDLQVLHILIVLAQKEKRQYERHNEKIDLEEFYTHGLKRAERSAITIHGVEEIEAADLHQVMTDYRFIFNEDLAKEMDATILNNELSRRIGQKISTYTPYTTDYQNEPFHVTFQQFVNELNELFQIRDPKRLFKSLSEKKDTLKQLSDDAKELTDFIGTNYQKYQDMRQFDQTNRVNYDSLGEKFAEKGKSFTEYLKTEKLPSDQFPVMQKTHKELEKQLKQLINEVRKNAVERYEAVYKVVEEQENQSKLSEPEPPSLELKAFIEELRNEQNISTLQLALERSSSKQAKCLEKIADLTGTKSVTLKLSALGLPSNIDSNEELDEYLKKLRERIQKELDAGNKIIIG